MYLKMKEIPIEFMPGFWVSIPSGLEGKGSGFLLAENIKSVFSVNCSIPKSQDFQRSWTILDMTEDEINNTNYLNAITRIISESWVDTMSIIIVGLGDDEFADMVRLDGDEIAIKAGVKDIVQFLKFQDVTR